MPHGMRLTLSREPGISITFATRPCFRFSCTCVCGAVQRRKLTLRNSSEGERKDVLTPDMLDWIIKEGALRDAGRPQEAMTMRKEALTAR